MAKRSRLPGPRSSRAAEGTAQTRSLAGIRYIESSALVAALLENDTDARTAVRRRGRRMVSALTLAETARAILRARVTGRLTVEQERASVRALARLERRCYVVAVTDAVLTRVRRPFPIEPIRTLDAIHLATAELLGEAPALVTIVTRDGRVRANAEALGFTAEYPNGPECAAPLVSTL